MAKPRHFSVELAFSTQPPRDGVLRLRLEDVSRVDADSKVVVERKVQFCPTVQRVEFDFGSAELEPGGDYIISGHLSPTGGTEFQRGDFITMQAYHPPRSGGRLRIELNPI